MSPRWRTARRVAALELAVVPTFATQWLLPRLSPLPVPGTRASRCTSRHAPGPSCSSETPLDAAILPGQSALWPGTEAGEVLMQEQLIAVASPGLLAGRAQWTSAVDVAGLPLLQASTRP